MISRALDTLTVPGGRVRVTGENLELIRDLRLRTELGSTQASYIVSSSGQITILVPTSGLLRNATTSTHRAAVTVDALSVNTCCCKQSVCCYEPTTNSIGRAF